MSAKPKVFLSILCMLFAFGSIFLINTSLIVKAYAQIKGDYPYSNSESPSLEGGNYIYLNNERTHFLQNENIIISYLIVSDENIVDYDYSSIGLSLLPR